MTEQAQDGRATCICDPPGWLETRDENCPVHGRMARPEFWADEADSPAGGSPGNRA